MECLEVLNNMVLKTAIWQTAAYCSCCRAETHLATVRKPENEPLHQGLCKQRAA